MKNLLITLELTPPFPYFIEENNKKVAGPFASEEEARQTLNRLAYLEEHGEEHRAGAEEIRQLEMER